MWRFVFMIAMLFHGIGHMLFLMNTWGYWRDGHGQAWLFSDVLRLNQTAGGIIDRRHGVRHHLRGSKRCRAREVADR